MKVPTCDCLERAYRHKYENNPHYGIPSEIVILRMDKATVSCNGGKHGTVKLRQNGCPQCLKPYVDITE